MDSDDLVRLSAEQDNLRAALDRIESSGNDERFAALVGTIWSLWYYQGQFVEGRRRIVVHGLVRHSVDIDVFAFAIPLRLAPAIGRWDVIAKRRETRRRRLRRHRYDVQPLGLRPRPHFAQELPGAAHRKNGHRHKIRPGPARPSRMSIARIRIMMTKTT